MHRRFALCAIVILALACRGERVQPEGIAQRDEKPVTSPPPPVEPAPGITYPVYRYPARKDPNEPARNPAIPPKLVSKVDAVATAMARRARVSGVVIVEIVIEADGHVSAGRVLKPLPFGLGEAALDAVRQWKYEPARDANGKPVPCYLNVVVNFPAR
ncbi:MAG TPA: energy transducer TonB [Thermoanaerobaculia bacterium]|nr:energy transducer TonB [Thermoanaerobaculia bacterium]